jgi:hypothetical protein
MQDLNDLNERIVYQQTLAKEIFFEEHEKEVNEYECPLCKGVLYEPMMCCHAHVFCKPCIDYFFQQNKIPRKICPLSPEILSEGEEKKLLTPIPKITKIL